MANDIIIERMRVAFHAEAQEVLAEFDSALLSLESRPGDKELMHRVFRAIHTLKGSGATAGFRRLSHLAHAAEEVFEAARSGRFELTAEMVDLGLRASDALKALLTADDEAPETEEERELLDGLSAICSREPAPQAPGAKAQTFKPVAYSIIFKPHRELFHSGSDPVTLLNELRELGSANIVGHVSRLPVLRSLDPESCYLWWEIRLVTDRGEEAIRDVFVFVEDECEVTIRSIEDQTDAVSALIAVPQDVLQLFVTECDEHLHVVETQALQFEAAPATREQLDAAFRAVHNLKGNTGVVISSVPAGSLAPGHALYRLVELAQAVETKLDTARAKVDAGLSGELGTLLVDSCDYMRRLVLAGEDQSAAEPIPDSLAERLMLDASGRAPEMAANAESAFANTARQCLEAMDACAARLAELPGDAHRTYLRSLRTLAAAVNYEGLFGLDETLREHAALLDDAIKSARALDSGEREGLLGGLEQIQARLAKHAQAAPAPEAGAPEPEAAPPAARARSQSAQPATIRVDQDKLDRLMRVVGELLVARGVFPVLAQKMSQVAQFAATGIEKELREAGAGISRIAEELQASVMAIRMLPVKTIFQKFPRLVRDLARSLRKEVQFTMEGEGTELDKTILEQVADPLVHLVRNAVDHGIELPEERIAAGKPPAGTVTLRAGNQAGGVIIEVIDDGRGIDGEALKRKAVEKGLLAADSAATLSEAAAQQLVFMPGLTTAVKVTDISGRGVGMDVVRNNIQNLHGTIDIQSACGRGTTFTIKLPTSLMISKGILLRASEQEFILPIGSILDMVKLPAAAVRTYRRQRMAHVRGAVYPLLSIAELCDLTEAPSEELSIAIIDAGKLRYGLIADRFLSEVEVVVKPLAGGLENCWEFLGAAIMGDGRVVLVLNPLECYRRDAA